jgi:hypothetical protein
MTALRERVRALVVGLDRVLVLDEEAVLGRVLVEDREPHILPVLLLS